mgnify:CR=1 FL=1
MSNAHVGAVDNKTPHIDTGIAKPTAGSSLKGHTIGPFIIADQIAID